MRGRDRRAGVTLLETLIALVVMAFISIGLASGLGMGARVMSRSGDIALEVEEAMGRSELRRGLERSIASPFPDQAGGGLEGGASEVTFYGFPDDALFWPGNSVRFVVRSTRDRGITVELTGLSAADKRETKRILVIASPEAKILITYWGRARPDHQPAWHDTWSADAGLPDLLKFAFGEASPAIPPMVVRPGKFFSQSEMSLSSLLPPALPSRP
jgi:Tfp pilus assembly protein PilV